MPPLSRAVRRGRAPRCTAGGHAPRRRVAQEHGATFAADKTANLVARLRHNVIRAGLRRINLAYSRISLEDVAAKLGARAGPAARRAALPAGQLAGRQGRTWAVLCTGSRLRACKEAVSSLDTAVAGAKTTPGLAERCAAVPAAPLRAMRCAGCRLGRLLGAVARACAAR